MTNLVQALNAELLARFPGLTLQATGLVREGVGREGRKTWVIEEHLPAVVELVQDTRFEAQTAFRVVSEQVVPDDFGDEVRTVRAVWFGRAVGKAVVMRCANLINRLSDVTTWSVTDSITAAREYWNAPNQDSIANEQHYWAITFTVTLYAD